MRSRVRWIAEEYVDLVVNEMLPRVTSDSLAEFCDVFCERGYFDIEQSRRKFSIRGERPWIETTRIHADQLSNSGAAKLAAELEAATAEHLEKTDEQGIAALKTGKGATGFAAGLSLCARIDVLSASARNDRGRSCGRDRE